MSYADPKGFYRFSETHIIDFNYWGPSMGWIVSKTWKMPDGSTYYLDGLDNTVWKMECDLEYQSLVRTATWILEKDEYELGVVGAENAGHEAQIFVKFKNMGEYIAPELDSNKLRPANGQNLDVEIMDITIWMEGQEYNLSLPAKEIQFWKASHIMTGADQTYKEAIEFLLPCNFSFSISDYYYEKEQIPMSFYIVPITEAEMKEDIEHNSGMKGNNKASDNNDETPANANVASDNVLFSVKVSASDGGVNLRSGPGTNYDIVEAMIPNGTELGVTDQTKSKEGSEWYYTKHNGKEGWIYAPAVTEITGNNNTSNGNFNGIDNKRKPSKSAMTFTTWSDENEIILTLNYDKGTYEYKETVYYEGEIMNTYPENGTIKDNGDGTGQIKLFDEWSNYVTYYDDDHYEIMIDLRTEPLYLLEADWAYSHVG